ncbi:hypothetical protein Pelo_5147 [Pelomyxa schiedti]|nr:hypothetical protein Pelo_5147 [Pelomyxa schiedti]
MAATAEYPTVTDADSVKTIMDAKKAEARALAFDEAGWQPVSHSEKSPNDDIRLFSRPPPVGSVHLVKGEADFAAPAPAVLALLKTSDPAARKKFSPEVAEVVKMNCPNDQYSMWIIRSTAPIMISPRETVVCFGDFAEGEGENGTLFFYGTSVGHAEAPIGKNYVRAVSPVVVFKIVPTGPSTCHVTRIAHMDPKGNIPAMMVNMFIQKQAHVFSMMREILYH